MSLVHGHIIVCELDALGLRVVEQLRRAGEEVVVLDAQADAKHVSVAEQYGIAYRVVGHDLNEDLAAVGVAEAAAIMCVGPDDAANLEIALLARQISPTVRVVARLGNTVLREAVSQGNGLGAVLDVADLAAPSVVEACLGRPTHPVAVAGVEFVVSGAESGQDGTLREIYADLAPVAVVRGDKWPSRGDVVACPGRDEVVRAGDWTTMIGTPAEFAAHGVEVDEPAPARRRHGPRPLAALRGVLEDVNPAIYRALGASLALLVGTTVLLRYTYNRPGMSFVDALYFSAETISTVGYGDFSFISQPTWLRLWAIMLMFAGITTTAILMAFITDLLISRRLSQSSGRRRARELSDHVIVIGFGSFGVRVAEDIRAAGRDVVVVERSDTNRFLSTAAELDVPVVFGDATLRRTLEDAGLSRASAVAVLTSDDMVNVEVGIVVREMLGDRWEGRAGSASVPVVLRVFDRTLGHAVAERFGFTNLRSTVELAAPWYIGAALGFTVLGTFSVGQLSFMIGAMHVDPGSELDSLVMVDLPTQTRVVAIESVDGAVTLHPRRDARLSAGDTVYLVGPYRELIDTLRKGQAGRLSPNGRRAAADPA